MCHPPGTGEHIGAIVEHGEAARYPGECSATCSYPQERHSLQGLYCMWVARGGLCQFLCPLDQIARYSSKPRS
jgi:hypothetical protein